MRARIIKAVWVVFARDKRNLVPFTTSTSAMATSTRMQLHRFLVLALVVLLALFPLSATANCLPCQRQNLLPRSLFNVFVAPLENDLVVAGQPFNFRWYVLRASGRVC